MEKKNLILALFGAIFIIGIAILIGSTELGANNMSGIMQMNGGSMDTNIYLIYLEQSIIKFRFLGSILSILSGLGIINLISSNFYKSPFNTLNQ